MALLELNHCRGHIKINGKPTWVRVILNTISPINDQEVQFEYKKESRFMNKRYLKRGDLMVVHKKDLSFVPRFSNFDEALLNRGSIKFVDGCTDIKFPMMVAKIEEAEKYAKEANTERDNLRNKIQTILKDIKIEELPTETRAKIAEMKLNES